MQDPRELYRFETDADLSHMGADVLMVAVGGLIDAGRAERQAVRALLSGLEHTVVASFDLDSLLDYRGRRPAMTFSGDRWSAIDDPSLVLYRVIDASGRPFLLLHGLEPDYQWERFAEAVRQLATALGVRMVVSGHGIPMAVPHTRPVGLTAHSSDARLIADYANVFGTVQVPGSVDALLHLRLGEAGFTTVGFAVHVPHYLGDAEFGDAAVALLEAEIAATGLDLPLAALREAAGANRLALQQDLDSNPDAAEVVGAMEHQYDRFMEGQARRSLLAGEVKDLPSPDELGAEIESFLAERTDAPAGSGEEPGEATRPGEEDPGLSGWRE